MRVSACACVCVSVWVCGCASLGVFGCVMRVLGWEDGMGL